MGVADRPYMRRRGVDVRDLPRSVTVWAIVVLAAAYVVDHGFLRPSAGGDEWLVLSRRSVETGRVWTLLTSALLHAGTWHLVLNAFGIWFFGRLVEESVGSAKYVAFLLLAAVLSHVPFVLGQYLAGTHGATIGASGVVMAALVFAAFRFPNLPVTLIVFPLRLWQLAALYVAVDVFQAVDRGGGMIDHLTHLGGAAYGLVAHRFGVMPALGPRHVRRPPREPGPYADAVPARVDALLDKINAEGIGALTGEEREFLRRHSGRYR